MTKHYVYALALLGIIQQTVVAEPIDPGTVKLYQVGKNGNYCLSTTADEKGCVSGSDESGATINVLDFAKGKKVVFENVSDAPHDMKFTGANAEDMAVQNPSGAAAIKQMGVVDMNKEKITCSFHGDQLGVGYRVPKAQVLAAGDGHKEMPGEAGSNTVPQAANGVEPDVTAKKVTRTGLADVSSEVIAKGRPADVEKLVAARPELAEKLQEVRPLLAQELSGKGGPVNQKSFGYVGGIKPTGAAGSQLTGDPFATKTGGAAGVAAVAANRPGAKTVATSTGAGGGTGSLTDSLSDMVEGFRTTGKKVRRLAFNGAPETVEEEAAEDSGAKTETTQVRALASSLGDEPSQRTKLKVVGQKKRAASGMDLNLWLIAVLALIISFALRMVLVGTKSKKERPKA